MSFLSDVLNFVAAEVTHLGLSEDGATEYAGGDYTPMPVTWDAPVDVGGDLWVFADNVPITFYGVFTDEFTHLILKRDDDADTWLFLELDSPVQVNESDAVILDRAGFTSRMIVPSPGPAE